METQPSQAGLEQCVDDLFEWSDERVFALLHQIAALAVRPTVKTSDS